MNWLEKKLGKYAISNLSLVLIIFYGFGYLFQYINASFLDWFTLDPYRILHGQVWRLISWLLIPPGTSNIIFVLIALLFYYSIGTSLERTWGTVRYNAYIFSGILFTVLGAFVMMGVSYLFYGDMVAAYTPELYFKLVSQYFSTYYISMSITLAYAATFPDAIILFMMVLPIKIKWLGFIYGALLGYEFVMNPFYMKIMILASLCNFLVFWFTSRDMKRFSPKEVYRRQSFKNAMNAGKKNRNSFSSAGTGRTAADGAGTTGTQQPVRMKSKQAIHRCCICGRTELTDPDIDFRYCSRCEGGYEFCQDHLFGHIHAKNGSAPVMDTPVTQIEPEDSGDGKKDE